MKNVKIELAIAGLFLGLLVLFLVWQHDGEDKPEPDTLRQVAVIPEDVKDLAIMTITEDMLVKDAAIVQRGRVISLALVVNATTTKEHARTLGVIACDWSKGLHPTRPHRAR